MRPFIVNGEAWRVVRVPLGDPRLTDRTGTATVGTADPLSRTVHIAACLAPPFLDRVLLHEVAHAVAMSHGSLAALHGIIPQEYWVPVEEWAAQFTEAHGIEAVVLASQVLGRPICVRGFCID